MRFPKFLLLIFTLFFALWLAGCIFTDKKSPAPGEEQPQSRLPTSPDQSLAELKTKVQTLGNLSDSLSEINIVMQNIDPAIDLVQLFATKVADNTDTALPEVQIIRRAENVISQANALEQQVSLNPYIETGTKEETVEVLNTIEKVLLQYSSDLQKGENVENFANIYDGMVTFLTNSQESLRDNFQKILVALATQESATAKEATSALNDFLSLARQSCPNEQQNIFALESLGKQLLSENELLQTASETANINDAQERMTQITAYVSEIYENLEIIVQNCQNE